MPDVDLVELRRRGEVEAADEIDRISRALEEALADSDEWTCPSCNAVTGVVEVHPRNTPAETRFSLPNCPLCGKTMVLWSTNRQRIDELRNMLTARQNELGALLTRVRAACNAFLIEGRNPEYHRRMKAQLQHQWPTLFDALSQLDLHLRSIK